MVQNSLSLRQDIGFHFIENLVVGQFETGGALQKNKPHQFPAKARNGEEDYFILYPLSNTFGNILWFYSILIDLIGNEF
jgi:hypothetical protein